MSKRDDTRDAILHAAIDIARRRGFQNIRHIEVAGLAHIAPATVFYHFKGMDELRSAVLDHAIKHEDLPLIAQGLAQRHASMRRLPEGLRRRAALCLA